MLWECHPAAPAPSGALWRGMHHWDLKLKTKQNAQNTREGIGHPSLPLIDDYKIIISRGLYFSWMEGKGANRATVGLTDS